MRTLVTGAAGFIGSHLTDRLLRGGNEVLGVDSFSDYYPRRIKDQNIEAARADPHFRLLEGDLSAIEIEPLLEGVDVVFHLAAQAGVRASWGKAFDTYLRDNLLATQRLLEAAKTQRPRMIVYASSSSIYGDAERYPTPESTIPLPISPYGVTKLGGEHLCTLYGSRFDVPVVRLRYFTVYGPRQRPDMAFHIFARALLTSGTIEVYGDGKQSREFTYVDDVVDATMRAAERGKAGAVYNVGGGSETSLNDAIALLQNLGGTKAHVVHKETAAGDVKRTAADTTLARRELGYEPRVGLEEGLRQELGWLQAMVELERTPRHPQ